MIRVLIVGATLMFAVVTFMPRLLENASQAGPGGIALVGEISDGTSPRFRARLDAGASCDELISIRDTYDPLSSEVFLMNEALLSVACRSD